MRLVEKSSLRLIMTKSASKLTASVCDVRRAVGSRRSKRENRGRTSVTSESPHSLYRKRTKSPVIGRGGSAARVSETFFPFMLAGADVFMRVNALFFLRARTSPVGRSLQTRW